MMTPAGAMNKNRKHKFARIKPMKKPTSANEVFAKYALNITTLCLTAY